MYICSLLKDTNLHIHENPFCLSGLSKSSFFHFNVMNKSIAGELQRGFSFIDELLKNLIQCCSKIWPPLDKKYFTILQLISKWYKVKHDTILEQAYFLFYFLCLLLLGQMQGKCSINASCSQLRVFEFSLPGILLD